MDIAMKCRGADRAQPSLRARIASSAASPARVRVFRRPVSPLAMERLDLGTSSARASSAITAALALPRSGTAATRTRSTASPSSRRSTPSMASRPALGVTRKCSRRPDAPDRNQSDAGADNGGIEVIADQRLDEEDDEEGHQRRQVEAGEI